MVPCAAATTGTDEVVSALMPEWMTFASLSMSLPPASEVAMSMTSPPAQNARPSPSMRITPTALSLVARAVTSAQASASSALKAFNRCGRFSVIRARPSSTR